MRTSILFLLILLSAKSFALIDSQIAIKPSKAYMNFFLEGYFPWLEAKFHYKPELPDSSGNVFIQNVLKELNHWKIPEQKELDQILIGQGFNGTTPFYTFRFYIPENLRDHSFIQKYKLGFKPLYIEFNQDKEVCFLKKMTPKQAKWSNAIAGKGIFYLGHYCDGGNLKYVSELSYEEYNFPNPFKNQSEYELRTFNQKDLLSVLHFVKNTHSAMISPLHLPFINAHGENLLLPFDKYSVNQDGDIIIYYP